MENATGSGSGSDQQEHILDNVEYSLRVAGAGYRLTNYLVDNGIIYLIARLVLSKPVVYLGTFIYQRSESLLAFYIFYYFVYICWSLLYKTGFEAFNKGKTIGKMITRTRAVNENGTFLSFRKALLRALCRLVPFEVLSALGADCYPWHDRWTKTYVIEDNLSILPVQ